MWISSILTDLIVPLGKPTATRLSAFCDTVVLVLFFIITVTYPKGPSPSGGLSIFSQTLEVVRHRGMNSPAESRESPLLWNLL
jgi:hypothetical protein